VGNIGPGCLSIVDVSITLIVVLWVTMERHGNSFTIISYNMSLDTSCCTALQ
jgi:hypothetical protein